MLLYKLRVTYNNVSKALRELSLDINRHLILNTVPFTRQQLEIYCNIKKLPKNYSDQDQEH